MPTDARPMVLVHGAWSGAWSWSALQHALDGHGLPSYALDLPGRGTSTAIAAGLDGDVAAVIAAVRSLDRPVTLVSHSYGGAVVNGAAAGEPMVAAVVHIAAFALAAGESVMGFLRAAPRHPVGLSALMQPQPDGSIVLDPDRAAELYGTSLSDADVRAHVARLGVQPAGTFTGTLAGDPFGRVPTGYVVCDRDDTVHPEHQRILAARCDRTVTIDSDHFPMLHSAARLADVLVDLVVPSGRDVAPVPATRPRGGT
jgi:pimeloyl-ACP methyl ester carboxylesterase